LIDWHGMAYLGHIWHGLLAGGIIVSMDTKEGRGGCGREEGREGGERKEKGPKGLN